MRAVQRCALALVVVLALAGDAQGALPRPPFDLHVAPGTVNQADTVRIRVTPRGGGAVDAGPVDVYLIWVYVHRALFLDPGGTWSSTPVPLRAGVSARDPRPVELEWRATPPGWISLGLVVVPAGADPLDRTRWRHAPLVRWLRVEPERHAGGREWLALGALAALGALGVGLVARSRPR